MFDVPPFDVQRSAVPDGVRFWLVLAWGFDGLGLLRFWQLFSNPLLRLCPGITKKITNKTDLSRKTS